MAGSYLAKNVAPGESQPNDVKSAESSNLALHLLIVFSERGRLAVVNRFLWQFVHPWPQTESPFRLRQHMPSRSRVHDPISRLPTCATMFDAEAPAPQSS